MIYDSVPFIRAGDGGVSYFDFLFAHLIMVALTAYQRRISNTRYRPLNSEQSWLGWHGPQARKNWSGNPTGKVSESVATIYIRQSRAEMINKAAVNMIFDKVGLRICFINIILLAKTGKPKLILSVG